MCILSNIQDNLAFNYYPYIKKRKPKLREVEKGTHDHTTYVGEETRTEFSVWSVQLESSCSFPHTTSIGSDCSLHSTSYSMWFFVLLQSLQNFIYLLVLGIKPRVSHNGKSMLYHRIVYMSLPYYEYLHSYQIILSLKGILK